MNHDDTSRSGGRRHSDAEAIAGLLPVPADRDLPDERYLHHKELLMRHIDEDNANAKTAGVPAPRPRRPLLRPALLVPVTAFAVAAAVVGGVVATGGDGNRPTAAERHEPGQGRPATVLLDRISTAALKDDAPKVGDDQYLYTRSKIREADVTSGKAVVSPLRDLETWSSQKPGPQKKLGISRSDGETLDINAQLGDTEGTEPGLSRPTYRWLAALPTDPDALLKYLYAKTPKRAGAERDQAVFDEIGSLLGGVMPPDTAGALYRAAALIPGVEKTDEAKDAIGRQGLGIRREDATFGTRTEWVFDPDGLAFLGSRSYLTEDGAYGERGTPLYSSALIAQAVVDEAGQKPGPRHRVTLRGAETARAS
ncbi:CU044_5270 family protein [Streptomyces sp. A1499]|uniref:CU044_5270 family protein n=1 Tax=Streptomyces sp. A1499 TaxID=2563104 RepID=UPI00109EC74B|nr:CU044_5270 family protein [Streptomyces sp. A1499]THC55252.1 hypothetical protein E7X58_02830 [Streptomyces sp. A1499]